MPDLTANPLSYPCPICGAAKGYACDIPSSGWEGSRKEAHSARYPLLPSRAPSDKCGCSDPGCDCGGPKQGVSGMLGVQPPAVAVWEG